MYKFHFLQRIAIRVRFYNKYIPVFIEVIVIVLVEVSLVVIVVVEVIVVTIICLVLIVDFAVSVPYVTVLFGNLIAFLYVCSITQQYNVHVDTGNGS